MHFYKWMQIIEQSATSLRAITMNLKQVGFEIFHLLFYSIVYQILKLILLIVFLFYPNDGNFLCMWYQTPMIHYSNLNCKRDWNQAWEKQAFCAPQTAVEQTLTVLQNITNWIKKSPEGKGAVSFHCNSYQLFWNICFVYQVETLIEIEL